MKKKKYLMTEKEGESVTKSIWKLLYIGVTATWEPQKVRLAKHLPLTSQRQTRNKDIVKKPTKWKIYNSF